MKKVIIDNNRVVGLLIGDIPGTAAPDNVEIGWSFDGDRFTPPVPPSSKEIKEDRWEAIKAERDRRRFDGGVQVGGHWYLSNQTACVEYNSIINLGLPDAAVIRPNWRTMNGAAVPMSPGLAKQIIVAGLAQAAAIDDAAQAHKAAMLASADPSVYAFSGGWPEIYGD